MFDGAGAPRPTRAFVLRMAPAGRDWVKEGLTSDEISIGWGLASELMNEALDYWQVRDVVKARCDADSVGYQKAGSVAGML